MEIGIQSKECLDVAVDHRIRALCKPVTVSSREPSKRISRIKTLGESLGRSRKEIQVTTELAGPAVKGGIAITLQQPRGNHPFEEGIDNVIADCETLYALYEIFPMVSCGTLDIRSDISIIDLLPYISDDITEIDDADLTKFFNESTQAICDKEPDVLLCAGKIWLPKPDKFNKIKGDARKLESIGFGRMFGQTPKLPVQAKIRGSNGSIVSINRVNGFHPSRAMNYYAHVSLMRQLLILICAEACGLFRDDWEDKQWMNELRSRCQELSTSHAEVPPPRYIPDYQELYYNTVIGLKQASTHLLSDPNLATSLTINYESLLSSNLSETCNNASLILRQMDSLFEQGWPDSKAWINESALEESAKDTCQVMRSLLKAAKDANGQRLSSIIQQGAKSILDCAADNKFDLEVISRAFLELAMNIETLLSDLWLGKKEAFGSSEQEEMLSNRISSMTLESDFVK
ncbi:hypothetical protein PTT_10278 [Pyrenophora teres f. teres 0-1]|uniref:Uncharacterized protein n=1 Tax=Pyrenophora teres f. teres (strain 0-1) TaxID=861557 RepID=E3RNW2_PYRTT|nr:hypothetical protein PTT_10278 [Pyrenophora teres f. teres 0-1]